MNESNGKLKHLLTSLPEAASKLAALAAALDNSQNYLRLERGNGGHNEEAHITEKLSEALQVHLPALKSISDRPNQGEAAANAAQTLLTATQDAVKSHHHCSLLEATAADQAAREKSMMASTSKTANTSTAAAAAAISSLINLQIPSPVPPPQLIDI